MKKIRINDEIINSFYLIFLLSRGRVVCGVDSDKALNYN